MGDGISNLLKYAFNMDPTYAYRGPERELEPSVGFEGLPVITTGSTGALRVEYLRATNPGDRVYQVQFCSDPSVSGSGGWLPATGGELVEPLNADWNRVYVTDQPPPGATNRFGRVRVILSGT
jgi:hypothetical protein